MIRRKNPQLHNETKILKNLDYVWMYMHKMFRAGIKMARNRITICHRMNLWYSEGIYQDCMVDTRHRFFDIQQNHRRFLWWLGKKCDVIYNIDNEFFVHTVCPVYGVIFGYFYGVAFLIS